MLSRQGDPDANDHAHQKTDEEIKPGRVAHRALAQIEIPGGLSLCIARNLHLSSLRSISHPEFQNFLLTAM